MKISSNFQEYYDSMRATDQDPDPLYVRLSKHYWLSLNNPVPDANKYIVGSQADERNSWVLRGRRIHFYGSAARYFAMHQDGACPEWIQRCVLGFCGRVYPIISVGLGKNVKHAFNPDRARKLVQDYNPEPEEYITDVGAFKKEIKNQKAAMLQQMQRPFVPNWNVFQFPEWAALLQGNNNQIGDDCFRHFRAPVLLASLTNAVQGNIPIITTNPQLKNFDFVQVFTPQQAYQELSMYIGNNLAGLDRIEPRPITDKLRSETKGFDKWSFKNQKNRKVSDRGDW